ncbi:hypothetical protein [Virgibacillus siamensis]|uniref:hypothetical protein n=1 Tax=Virgibacillus siamensis TaxID=480071 RepID=UPI000984B4F8|nr:hypothetical protein [Virgibacillus siamensis]
MKDNHRTYFKWIITGAIVLPLLFLIQTAHVQTVTAHEYSDNPKASRTSVEKVQAFQNSEKDSQHKKISQSENMKKLSDQKVISMTNQFMNILIQDLDKHNKVIHFDSKEALLNKFETVTTREVALKYVDFYFKEKADGLYVVPTERPSWFQEQNDYDMIRKDKNVVQVVQHNKNDLYGSYTVKFEFTYSGGKWKITSIKHQ